MTDEAVQLTTEACRAAPFTPDDGRTPEVGSPRAKVDELEAENGRLRGLLKLTPEPSRGPVPMVLVSRSARTTARTTVSRTRSRLPGWTSTR